MLEAYTPASRARLHPLTGLLVLSWGFTYAYTCNPLPPLLLGATLQAYSRVLLRLLPLYAWIGIPVALVVGAVGGPRAGIEAAVGVLSLALIATGVLSSVDPLEIAYVSYILRLPPWSWFLVVIVLRMASYLAYSVQEARAALRGRGVSGLRLLLALPIPLVVHAFNLSSLLAEALAFKMPGQGRTWSSRPRLGALDYVMFAIITATTVACIVWPI